MSEGDKVEEHQHYSGGALLLAAVAVDMIAIFVAVFWLSESYLLSGLAVAGGRHHHRSAGAPAGGT